MEMIQPILARAEAAAAHGLVAALRELRFLGFEDFGELMWSMPRAELPNLSAVLPRMAPEAIQKEFTGAHGLTLLQQTLSFAWMVRARYAEITGKRIDEGTRVMDFGCGYGRIIRLMYYLTNPENITAVDAWDGPIKICRECGVQANFVRTSEISGGIDIAPASVDIAYSFSVFTHLRKDAIDAAFAAMRVAMKPGGVLIATFRPIECWAFMDNRRGTSLAQEKERLHRIEGFAYHPITEVYGDCSIRLDLLTQIPGWRMQSWDRSLLDPHQVAVAFRPI